MQSPAPIDPSSPTAAEASLASLAGLYREHCDQVFAAAYRVTGNPMDAEDVLQTVFLRLLRREDGVDLGDTAPAYLHRAAVNAALDTLRRRKRQRSVDVEDFSETLPDGSLPGPERTSRGREVTDALRQALTRVTPASAEIFALRYFEGIPNQQIAGLLGLSPTAVAVSLHRTRHRLQTELAQHYDA